MPYFPYTLHCTVPFIPKICPFLWGYELPSNTSHPTQHPRQDQDRLNRVFTIHSRYQQTDRQTDRTTTKNQEQATVEIYGRHIGHVTISTSGFVSAVYIYWLLRRGLILSLFRPRKGHKALWWTCLSVRLTIAVYLKNHMTEQFIRRRLPTCQQTHQPARLV